MRWLGLLGFMVTMSPPLCARSSLVLRSSAPKLKFKQHIVRSLIKQSSIVIMSAMAVPWHIRFVLLALWYQVFVKDVPSNQDTGVSMAYGFVSLMSGISATTVSFSFLCLAILRLLKLDSPPNIIVSAAIISLCSYVAIYGQYFILKLNSA